MMRRLVQDVRGQGENASERSGADGDQQRLNASAWR